MIRLLEQRDDLAHAVLPPGRDVVGWHQALTAEIAAHLSPAHAALLATPVWSEAGTAWFADGTAMRRFGELERADRELLTTAVGAMLSDIRRLAESGKAPGVASAWPALGSVPDLTHLFAVDGRPVLAGWGFAPPGGGMGPLAAFDDGIAWRPSPRWPWPVYAGTLAALAGLALFAGLVLVPLGGWFVPSPAVCRAAPGQLDLLSEQSREASRTDELNAELAQLREGRGEQALRCPIPREAIALPPPVPPAPAPAPPAPPPAPPKRADLPEDQWNKHDLSILKGCWKRYTNMSLEQADTHRVFTVRDWELCFDAEGHGTQTIELSSGARCKSSLNGQFDGDNNLRFEEPRGCVFPSRSGAGYVVRAKVICHRESDIEASCERTALEKPWMGVTSPGRFRRADAPPP